MPAASRLCLHVCKSESEKEGGREREGEGERVIVR